MWSAAALAGGAEKHIAASFRTACNCIGAPQLHPLRRATFSARASCESNVSRLQRCARSSFQALHEEGDITAHRWREKMTMPATRECADLMGYLKHDSAGAAGVRRQCISCH